MAVDRFISQIAKYSPGSCSFSSGLSKVGHSHASSIIDHKSQVIRDVIFYKQSVQAIKSWAICVRENKAAE